MVIIDRYNPHKWKFIQVLDIFKKTQRGFETKKFEIRWGMAFYVTLSMLLNLSETQGACEVGVMIKVLPSYKDETNGC